MGTVLDATVYQATRSGALAATEHAFQEVRRLEDLLTTWRLDSELSRLNRASPGEWVSASPELVALLLEARRWSVASGGTFDPGIGALIDAWDLRGQRRRPPARALAHARDVSRIARFGLDSVGHRVMRPAEDSWIDPGGFGKGAALRAAARVLEAGAVDVAFLDFGGQVLAMGAPGDRDGWLVDVAHPTHREISVATLSLRGHSAATSSAAERGAHVVDPRSGHPVDPWGSVTVVASDPLVADALATALFVMGPDDALRWAAARHVAALVVRRTGTALQVCWTDALAGHLVAAPRRGRTCHPRRKEH